MTMTSEDGDILALLSEPSLKEEQLEASESDAMFSAIMKAIESNKNVVEVSPEEAAWADSCFVQTSELSYDDWGAMRSMLLDALEKPTESPSDTSESAHNAISEAKPHSLPAENISEHGDIHMEQINNTDDDKDGTEAFEIADVIRRVDDNGKQIDSYVADAGDELVLEQTQSTGSIFKVWDLELPFSDDDDDGELELVKDLKKLLKENSLPEDIYPTLPPDDAAKPLSQISINEIVAGLSDLSIQQAHE
ncbi:uncharacterized protein [Zea mays]|jgi:hypothetical protein|uniref:Uncharacterized protein n=2 Tax=Zea mays TaxID=4577 RepID=B6T6L9_MAIZE|nr:uncharacterized protein LOC100276204 [Zea mays]XP_020407010.1 uncharacterized protein LOC100276204 isoform X1 [Zea mays]ACG32752.1 hypothetical protein [Zea mays]AQK52825.1 hypothetical protein ZEAMMB73_Zm00001d050608 [Zea mays]|eukprot:NP_001143521.1 uncharacterized protein LOC100276204 [Zea mays]